MTGKTDKPRQVAVIGHVHPSGLNAAALVKFAQSGGQIVDAIRGREITAMWHDEMEGTDMLDETAPPPQATPTDPAGAPPRALSNHVNHRDFHPSYMRVGVRIDGVERKDLKWYDADAGLAATTDGVMLKSETIEPYWRYAENRQQRRARERWEKDHPGWVAKNRAKGA